MITSLGDDGAGLCASRAFVCFVRVSFCHFSLPLGFRGWLRLVIVALPGFSINFFFKYGAIKLNSSVKLYVKNISTKISTKQTNNM